MKRVIIGFAILTVLVHLVDLVFSCWLLSKNWMIEANPAAKIIWENGGVPGLVAYKLFMIAAVGVLFYACYKRGGKLAAGLILGMALGAGMVVVWQLYETYKVAYKWSEVDRKYEEFDRRNP